MSRTKNIPTDHNSVGVWLSFLNVSLHHSTNCGHPGGRVTIPAASESLGSGMGWLSEQPEVEMQHLSLCAQGLSKCSPLKGHRLPAGWWPILQEKWLMFQDGNGVVPWGRVVPGGCRVRSCCTSSGSRRSSAGNCGRGCFCSCREYTAAEREWSCQRWQSSLPSTLYPLRSPVGHRIILC